MEVRKFKIEQRDGIITKYYWKKCFLFFGQWIPYHNISFGNDNYAKYLIQEIDEFTINNK